VRHLSLVFAVLVAMLAAAGPPAAEECLNFHCYTARVPSFSLPAWLGGRSASPTSNLEIHRGARHFAVYYGWPSQVNGAGGDLEKAIARFAQFGVLVLGDGLEHANHPDHLATVAVIARLNELGTTRVFGYVDLGVTTQNLPLPTLVQYAEAWRRIGAVGIFLDDAGADYGVDSARRDRAVHDIRKLGMRVILNAHDPADAFRGSEKLGPGDGYLFESFQVSDGRIQSPNVMLAKADLTLRFAAESGADIYALASGPADDPGLQAKLSYAWWSALLYGFRYFQYTGLDYGSSASQLPWYPLEFPEIGQRYLDDTVHHSWAEGRHWRWTDRGQVQLDTGAALRGTFLPGQTAQAGLQKGGA
jgi:hypothetical protein